jgi:3-dehydroquinate synthetase
MGVTPSHVGERQRVLFERYELPVRLPRVDVDAVIAATALDKKVAAKKVRWVLLEDFGRPVLRDDVPAGLVRDVLSELIG